MSSIALGELDDEGLDAFVRQMRTQRVQKSHIERTPTGRKKKAAEAKPAKKLNAAQLAAIMGISVEAAEMILNADQ